MSLIARLRSALALPAVASGDVRRLSPYDDTNHLWSFVAPDWLGAQDHRLTRAAAMRIPAVNRSRRIVCNSVARIPLRAYVGDELAPKQPTWLDRTDGPVSPYHRMLWTVDDLLFYGWSAWAVSRGADGAVIAADRIPFDQWHVEPETNKIMWTSPGGTAEAVAEGSVVLIPGSDDGLLADGAVAVRHAADLLRNAAKAAENPSAYLDLHQTNDLPITDTDRKAIIDGWVRARRGENGGVAFSSAGIEVRELGAPIEHLLVEGRNAAALDVARAVGVPGATIDATTAGASLTYETAESKARDLIDYGLSAYMAPISARLGQDDVAPRGTAIKFDLEDVIGPKATAGTPDDGAASTAPATPEPTKQDAPQ